MNVERLQAAAWATLKNMIEEDKYNLEEIATAAEALERMIARVGAGE